MNTVDEFSLSAINQKRKASGSSNNASTPYESTRQTVEISNPSSAALSSTVASKSEVKPPGFSLPVDPFRVVDVLWRQGKWCLIAGGSLGVILFGLGKLRVHPNYTSHVQLVRQDMPVSFRASDTGEPFKPTAITMPILQSLMRSGAMMDRISAAAKLPQTTILAGLVVTPERNSDLIHITFTADASPQQAVDVLNLYSEELISFTKALQSRDASEINGYLKSELTRVENDLMKKNEELLRYAKESDMIDGDKEMDAYLAQIGNYDLKYEGLRLDFETLDLKIKAYEKEFALASPLAGKLAAANGELAQLLLKYTEANPYVQEARERVKSLEDEMKQPTQRSDGPPPAGESSVTSGIYMELVQLKTTKQVLAEQLIKIDKTRSDVRTRLNQLPRKQLEYAIIKSHRQSLETARGVLASRQREAQLYEENALGYCRLLAPARIEDVVADSRTKKVITLSVGGVAFGLLITAALLLFRELADGRVRTAADLKRVTKLPVLATLPEYLSNDDKAQQMWAFRTWTRIQPTLATSDGNILCGLLSQADESAAPHLARLLGEAAAWRGSSVLVITKQGYTDKPSMPLSEALSSSLIQADQWLAQGSGIVFLTVDQDWIWNAEQRLKLDSALNLWSRHRGGVIFVELPPASRPETLLMAERLPQILWVGSSGSSIGSSITDQLAIYRHAGCKLLGAMLDHAPSLSPPILNKLSGLTAALAFCFATAYAGESNSLKSALSAQEATAVLTSNSSKSEPEKLAPLPQDSFAQEAPAKLKLGPGDGMNIVMFGKPETARSDLSVGPDGRLSYLQAQNIKAEGLSIDELREAINQELSKYYQKPRVMIMPTTFQSKKVYILGKIVKKGTVNYDRPLTVLEAVTEAGGLEVGRFGQNTVELADLGRSFLVRGQRRIPVNFENLFYKGDMSQNVHLQPGDYLYFPSANANEFYVMGNVASQGSQGLLGHTTVTSAIAQAGGFTKRAYQSKVLVIRGSFDKPQTFVVDMDAVIKGRAKSFRLEPKDIVYVSDKPWSRAEDIVDIVISAFFQGAVATYTSTNVAPLITKPFFNNTTR
jgi:protein involved in polysaccharide export with SLBB domain/capsular polysaccharide biosynthesis protein